MAAKAGWIVWSSTGLAGCFAAAGLFSINRVAALSHRDIGAAGVNDDFLRGCLCVVLFLFGCGHFSCDRWLRAHRWSFIRWTCLTFHLVSPERLH